MPVRNKIRKAIKPKKPGSKLSQGEMARQWRAEEELLRSYLASGLRKEEILLEMGISSSDYVRIEKRLMARDGQQFISQPTALRYYFYCLQQEQCVKDLDQLREALLTEFVEWRGLCAEARKKGGIGARVPTRPSPQALIMTIKAKSDILDRALRTGQEMGIIEKRAKEIRVSGNLNLAAMPTMELKRTLEVRLKSFSKLVESGELPPIYKKMIESGEEQ